jgi:hypothetical protein
VEGVRLEVVLEARVRRARREQQVRAVPEHVEGAREAEQIREDARVVVEVLDVGAA